jgi:hypothetical protein
MSFRLLIGITTYGGAANIGRTGGLQVQNLVLMSSIDSALSVLRKIKVTEHGSAQRDFIKVRN